MLSWIRYSYPPYQGICCSTKTRQEGAHPSAAVLDGVLSLQGHLGKAIANAGGKLTERQAVQKVVQPCLTALADLHAKTLAHGAIVPQNILFSSQEPACKLAGVQPHHFPCIAIQSSTLCLFCPFAIGDI